MTNGNFTKSESIRPEGDFKILGQSAFVDFGHCHSSISFEGSDEVSKGPRYATLSAAADRTDWGGDGDGSQDHLLPVCMDETCKRSAIFLTRPGHSQDRWLPILTDFQRRDTLWGFVPPTASSAGAPRMPITLHLGDYNLDGFPDALAILRNTSGSAQQAFLLENVPCSNTSCRDAGRTFRIHWDQSDLSSIRGAAVIATFFDIYEDAISVKYGNITPPMHLGLCSLYVWYPCLCVGAATLRPPERCLPLLTIAFPTLIVCLMVPESEEDSFLSDTLGSAKTVIAFEAAVGSCLHCDRIMKGQRRPAPAAQERGILDMIVLSKEDGKEELTIHALKNNFEADAYFVKVIGECKALEKFLSCSPSFSQTWVQIAHQKGRKQVFLRRQVVPSQMKTVVTQADAADVKYSRN
ncbi:hypothetical protein Z043_105119 [Scleropages formosus]|uniref:Uncharacterized protein n=1 Tax=Scleropages formosus TaxID=113540 RepID=A0A0P7Z4T2_SCLFO|nr:hypothetical protein Z043_105119 [Scleropages formosus]